MKRYKFVLIIILTFLLMSGSSYPYSGKILTKDENNLSGRSVEQLPASSQTSQNIKDFVDDNTLWTDYVVDDDGNGFNDRLVIDLGTVDQSAPNFDVYGVLRSSNGTMLCLSRNSTTGSGSYTPFEGHLTLSFRGSPIKAAGLDGRYDLWIDIIPATSPMNDSSLNLSLMYTTNQAYDHTMFESPSATMVGFSDHGFDTDKDQLLNEIDISVSLSVIKAGEYSVTVFLEENNIFSLNSQRYSGYWWGYLDSGSSTIDVAVSTSTFFIEKINGPYNLTLAVLSEYPTYPTFPYQQFLENVHTTADYSYSNFDPVPAYFTKKYEDRGVDSDSTGKFDQLEIIVEVNVTEDGDYRIDLDLTPIIFDSNNFRVYYGSTSGYWSPGVRNVSIMINTASFYYTRLNTSYIISNIWLYETSYGILDHRYSFYTTRFYNYDEFDLPGAFLMGNYWDQGIDTDFNGIFDHIEIIVEVNVTKTGDYDIYLTLISTVTGSDLYLYGYTSGNWTSGIRNISVMVDALSLYSRRLNTSFEVDYIQIRDSNSQIMDKKQSVYTTHFYNYDEFDTTFGQPTTSVSTTTKGAPGWNIPIFFLSFCFILLFKRWKKRR